MRCPKCSYFFSEEYKICPRCGVDVSSELSSLGYFPPRSKKVFLETEDFKTPKESKETFSEERIIPFPYEET